MPKFIILAVTLLSVLASTAIASHRYVEFPELVHTSHAIVDGRVDEVVSWMDDEGMIHTEVHLDVIDLVHADPVARAFTGPDITLRFLGGITEDMTMSVSGTPSFTEGERVILFTLLDNKNYICPIVGGEQGVFRVLERGPGNTMYPMKTSGRGVLDIVDNRIQLSPYVTEISGGRAVFEPLDMATTPVSSQAGDSARARTVPEQGQLLSLRKFKQRIKAQLQQPGDAWDLTLQIQDQDRDSSPDLVLDMERNSSTKTETSNPKPINEPAFENVSIPSGPPSPRGSSPLCYCGSQSTQIVMQMVPSDWWNYSLDETALWYWNQYINIFNITASDGTFAPSNGENEFGGWPSTFDSLYNYTWGASTLAVTLFWQSNPCNAEEISETDVFFNPNYTWTSDFDTAFNSNFFPTLYQPITIHEIGHTWGSIMGTCSETYDYNELSVMHAGYDDIMADGRGVHAGDTWGIRGDYEDQESVITVVDVGCESYYSNNGTLTSSTTSPGSGNVFFPGDAITIENITCENMSSSSTSNVRVRLWLSWNDTISDNDTQMGDWTFSSLGSEAWWTGDLSTSIPNLPAGTYFLGAIMTVEGSSYTYDGHGWNNKALFVDTIEIGTPPPANDDCNDAQSVSEGSYSFSNEGASTDGVSLSSCGASNAHNDVWFEYTPDCDGTVTISTCDNADFDTVIAVYESNSTCPPGSSDQLGCNDDSGGCSGNTSELVIDLGANETYRIRLGAFSSNGSGEGTLTISMDSYVANDTCDGAETIGEGQTSVDTDCAGTDGSGECSHSFYNDVWYRYVATCTGTLTVDTCDSGFNDTVLAVYYQSGADCSQQVLLGCNDDTPASCSNIYASQVDVNVMEDGVYLIRVGHYSSFDTGQFSLGLSLEGGGPNDDCIDAFVATDGDIPFDTRCADTDGLPHVECEYDGQTWHDIWYTYTATVTGDLTLSTCDQADFDTDLALYRNSGTCPPGDDDLIGCNDDGPGCSGYTSYLEGRVFEGEQYLIRVGGWNINHDGTGTLSINSVAVCITDVSGGDGVTNVLDLLEILAAWGSDDPNADVNADGVVDVLDLLAIIAAWGPCPGECEDAFACGDVPEDYYCNTDCVCFELADGSIACIDISQGNCTDFQPCPAGDCPPGYGCVVSSCCADPICLPYCQ